MFSHNNTSQDPDYEGPTGHEKKMHKTHFHSLGLKKHTHPKDDPNWIYVGVGRWKWIGKEKRNDFHSDL